MITIRSLQFCAALISWGAAAGCLIGSGGNVEETISSGNKAADDGHWTGEFAGAPAPSFGECVNNSIVGGIQNGHGVHGVDQYCNNITKWDGSPFELDPGNRWWSESFVDKPGANNYGACVNGVMVGMGCVADSSSSCSSYQLECAGIVDGLDYPEDVDYDTCWWSVPFGATVQKTYLQYPHSVLVGMTCVDGCNQLQVELCSLV